MLSDADNTTRPYGLLSSVYQSRTHDNISVDSLPTSISENMNLIEYLGISSVLFVNKTLFFIYQILNESFYFTSINLYFSAVKVKNILSVGSTKQLRQNEVL